ncbi:hypothetical protein ABIA06_003810 [Bradyrhizobium yuanmingense]
MTARGLARVSDGHRSPMMPQYPCFARRRNRVFGKSENVKPFQPHRYCAWGCFSRLCFGGVYPAPARFFCQTKCTAQVQPGGCEARSFGISSFAGVAAKGLSCDGM